MKKAIASLLLASFCQVYAGNLLMNGDFKVNGKGYPLYWMFRNHSAGITRHFATGGPDGKDYVKIHSPNGLFTIQQNNLKLVKGGKYKICGYFRTKNLNGKNSGFKIAYIGGIDKLPKNCPKWKYIEKEITLKYASKHNYKVIIEIDKQGGEMDVADLKLLPMDAKAKQGSRRQLESMEPCLVPLNLLYYIPHDKPQLDFFWVGQFPGNKNSADFVFTFSKDKKTIKHPCNKAKFTLKLTGVGLGEQNMDIKIVDRKNKKILFNESYDIRVVNIPKPGKTRRLNNLVTEVFNGKLDSGATLKLVNPRNGWLFFKFAPETAKKFKIKLDAKTVMTEKSPRMEAVRLLDIGKYTVSMKGAKGKLVVKLIPDILNFPLQSSRLPGNGCYDWSFAKKYMVPALTTFDVGGLSPKELQEFKSLGLLWLANFGVLNPKKPHDRKDFLKRLETSPGILDKEYDGMTLDETEYWQSQAIDPYAWVLKKLKNQQNKIIHSWIIGPPSPSFANLISAATNISNGHGKILYEVYNRGQTTEEDARRYIGQTAQHIALYRAIAPGLFSNISIILGNFSQSPMTSLAHYPDIDYKYYLDMQAFMFANNPAFKDLNGVGWWGTHNADEEIVRWSFKLMRHYAIEGNKDMLSKRYGYKYHPGHLKNCDFANGLTHWATKGKVKTDKFKKYGSESQRRYGSIYDVGDTFAVLSHTGNDIAEVRQTAKGLKVGKVYSLSFMVADYNDIKKGINNPRRFKLEAALDGAYIIRRACYVDRRNRPKMKARINFFKIIFKAEKSNIDIVFSNKKSEDGQALALNYVCLRPYFSKEKYK